MTPPVVSTVILVDDDDHLLRATAQWLELGGWQVYPCSSAAKALNLITTDFGGVVITDMRMPQMDGRQLFERIREIDSEIPVIFITGHGDVSQAVEAMQQGAYDFVVKPFRSERMLELVATAAEKRQVALERRQIRDRATAAQAEWPMIGASPAMEKFRQRLRRIAESDLDTIIEGETGVGKELAARALHSWGGRRNRPFVTVHCGALPASSVDSELFGHELGAFPGAVRSRVGRIESAHRGVLFLDDIESTPPDVQVKLLRFLEEREVTPLGANEPRSVDVRVVVSTKLDFSRPDNASQLRPDLFHRLNVARIMAPPLRDRRGDIPALFAHFAARAADRLGVTMPPIGEPVRRMLTDHPWPGNVRELAHFAERFAAGLESTETVETLQGAEGLREKVDRYELDLICEALSQSGGDVATTIETLMLPRKTFYDKVKRHSIDLASFRQTRQSETSRV